MLWKMKHVTIMGLLIVNLLSIANCSIRMKGMSSWQTSMMGAIVNGKKNQIKGKKKNKVEIH